MATILDIYDDYLNSTSKRPFLAFLGREGMPGHAFVGVGVDLEAGLRVYERLFGLYPDGAGKLGSVKMVFSSTSGRLDFKWSDIAWDVELVKFISDEQRDALLAQFLTWSANAPRYSLLGAEGKNCSMLAADVASDVGMTIPAGAGVTFPWVYIKKLKAANP